MVFFGLQAFIKEYLMGYFQENFFDLTEDEMVSLYTDSMDIQIGKDNYDLDKIVQLHKLGYLPLEIRALSEGTLVPMGVPCIEITNTNDDFAWLVQWIECILQVELWKPCCHATTRKWGGSTTIELDPNLKLEEITWKDDSLWYLTRPMTKDDVAETHTFKESSNLGIIQGTVTVIETKE